MSAAMAHVVAEAMAGFHQPVTDEGLGERHGDWNDSLALTHCLCWGAAWRMLDYLIANPDAYEHAKTGRTARNEAATFGGDADPGAAR